MLPQCNVVTEIFVILPTYTQKANEEILFAVCFQQFQNVRISEDMSPRIIICGKDSVNIQEYYNSYAENV